MDASSISLRQKQSAHRLRVFIASLTLALLLSSAFAQTANAYSINGHHMVDKIWYQSSSKFTDLTRSEFRTAMQEWNVYIPEYRRLCYDATTHALYRVPFTDGKSRIYKEPNSDPSNLAMNYYIYAITDSSVIAESDININSNQDWANGSVSGRFDVKSVMLHELGHTTGLSHSSYRSAIMYSTFARAEVRHITSDDISGLRFISANA